ncbi:MAG: DUF565 domain-containing protein [Acaryochloridaceae cyanobacterium SU_2_1]|nr:DUF565 domain-containing protein [Acaryochloridaceae cyanobacterium SU_2_1]
MQNTRLNTLFTDLGQLISVELRNPWRRLSVLAIALLFGIYVGISFASVAGQRAYLDVVVAAFAVTFSEIVSWIHYRNRGNVRKTLWGEALNFFKMGLTYGLFVIAFMLGS